MNPRSKNAGFTATSEERSFRRPAERFVRAQSWQTGFTLIELMVIVAIIGLLSSIVMVNLMEARQSAQDAKRIAEMRQIQNALELYRDRTGGYPDTEGDWENDLNGSDDFKKALKDLVKGGYLPKVAEDPFYPNNQDPNYFTYRTPGYLEDTNTALCGSNTNAEYVLIFNAENSRFNLPEFNFSNADQNWYCLLPPE